MYDSPKIIKFLRKGDSDEGYLSIYNRGNYLPKIRRVFWSYNTPTHISRGRHAHFETEMILVAVVGEIAISTTCGNGNSNEFVLSNPNEGLFIPHMCWHEMSYSNDAVQLVLCSSEYDEADYIRVRADFERLIAKR